MGLILPVAVEEVEKRRERMNEMALITIGNEFRINIWLLIKYNFIGDVACVVTM